MESKRSLIGFTLIELVIVISILLVIASFAAPMGLNFYQNQILDETTKDILAAIRRSQNQAIAQKNDSAFGIKFLPDAYVIFQGGSYAGRAAAQDEIFYLPDGLSTNGIDEITFSKLTGMPSPVGVLNVVTAAGSQTVTVNEQGKIEYQ